MCLQNEVASARVLSLLFKDDSNDPKARSSKSIEGRL
jgi:hypothetical protein